jgi:hypothetical protein
MPIVKSTPVDKYINGQHVKASEKVITNDKQFRSKGEEFVVIKGVDFCKVTLDHTTTDHIKIKALTNVLILPSIGKIDEEYDEILIGKGACVEFVYNTNCWYIMSSDGIKLD